MHTLLVDTIVYICEGTSVVNRHTGERHSEQRHFVRHTQSINQSIINNQLTDNCTI